MRVTVGDSGLCCCTCVTYFVLILYERSGPLFVKKKKKKKTGLNVHIRLIKDVEKGGGGWKGVWRWGKREIIYLLLHCHHQNGSCIKMGSDESHFNVSVGSDGQSHKTVSTNHNLFEENGEPKRYRTEVLPLTSLTPYR